LVDAVGLMKYIAIVFPEGLGIDRMDLPVSSNTSNSIYIPNVSWSLLPWFKRTQLSTNKMNKKSYSET
jgi:hypothetical protein